MAILKIKDKGVWKEIQAIKGDTGNGIQNIEKVSTVGNVDTYAINYTDGTQTTFDVTNSEVTKEQLDEVDNKAKNTRNELERVKNDVLETGTDTDTYIHLQDSAMAEYQELSVDGVCEQETTTGKNLIGTNYITGVTINDATTNDITIRNNWASTIVSNENLLKVLKPNTTYTISYKYKVLKRPSEFGSDNKHGYILGLYDSSSGLTFLGETQKNTIALNTWDTITKTFTTPASLTNYKMIAYDFRDANNTTTGAIEVSELQIEEGSTATSFEPYTGGQPSPSPDYPQEIEVGRGKNLFDESQLLQAEGWTYSNGYYNGLIEKYYVAFRYGFNFNTTFEENTQYTIKLNAYTTGGTPRFKIEYTDGTNYMMNFTATTPTNYSYTTTKGKTISKIIGEYGTGGSQTLYLKDLQLEKGSVATSYLPYNTIEAKSIGKNLLKGLSTSLTYSEYWFDINKYYFTPLEDGWGKFEYDNTNGTSTVFINAKVNLSAVALKENTTYTILTEIRNSNISENIGAFFQIVTNNPTVAFSESKNLTYNSINTGGSFKTSLKTKESFNGISLAIDSYLRLSKGTKGTVEARITLVEGDYTNKDLTYEQYKESSITANLPEGEFIGKISDTYKDTLKVEYNEDDGQHHLKLYKNVGKVVLDGSEDWEYRASYNYADRFVKDGFFPTRTKYIICNYLPNSFGLLDIYPYIENNTKQCVINFSEKGTTTLAQFKSWLSTNKPEVYCALAEPYTVDLGIVDMPITYNEITNLFTDSNLSLTINVKYYRNFISTVRNLQVNEKALKQELVDINTRLSALESAQTSVISESEVVE